MTLTVRAEGIAPRAVGHRCMCRADRWPSPGDVLPVTLDARRPDRLEVEWDEVEPARERAWATATQLAADGAPDERAAAAAAGVDLDALRRAFPGATIEVETHSIEAGTQPDVARQVLAALQAAEAAAPYASDDAADRIGQLERLAKLREACALTEAEFEAEYVRGLIGE